MNPLYFLTTNKNKFAEVQRVIPYVAMLPVELPEIQEMDLQKIIEKKLEAATHYLQQNADLLAQQQINVQHFFVEDKRVISQISQWISRATHQMDASTHRE